MWDVSILESVVTLVHGGCVCVSKLLGKRVLPRGYRVVSETYAFPSGFD